MKVLLIDNYDSFTYNLYHYLVSAGADVEVHRNDEINLELIPSFDGVVFSPGPGLPREAGRMMQIIEVYYQTIPMLGVCLGHQALVEFFGGELENLKNVCHGQPTTTRLDVGSPLFADIPAEVQTGHYHSWVAKKAPFPIDLKIIAENDHGWIMAIEHGRLPIFGVQFHPESVLTPQGYKMIENWLRSLEQ